MNKRINLVRLIKPTDALFLNLISIDLIEKKEIEELGYLGRGTRTTKIYLFIYLFLNF
ncbi:hypothetical protein RchiOBHm_Chr3g0483471 [Rosa chinensis]|uniref:Uncharacterized protein n=1 Tax=Rosa chinensis TaxID=74649 RepID=A0A2P6REF9_ROSCH|nr:hypothetical protein RchiOBHm_Chr3g0483471 [Rosa chinensis]